MEEDQLDKVQTLPKLFELLTRTQIYLDTNMMLIKHGKSPEELIKIELS